MLRAFEDAGIWLVMLRDPLNLGGCTDWMGFFNSSYGHRISNYIVGKIHVLVEEAFELVTSEESLTARVLKSQAPDELFLALGRQGLIFGSIKIGHSVDDPTVTIEGILGPIAIGEVVSRILIRLVVTEVMEPTIVSDVEHFRLVFRRSLLATTGLTMFTTLRQVTEGTDL